VTDDKKTKRRKMRKNKIKKAPEVDLSEFR
jgi:hypothetical protein